MQKSKQTEWIVFTIKFLILCFYSSNSCAWNYAEEYRNEVENDNFLNSLRIREVLRQSDNVTGSNTDLESSQNNNSSETYVVNFYGPTIDIDLTNFYAYFAKEYSDALIPINARSDIVKDNCKTKPYTCGTLSGIVFYYGLLARAFPEDFESQVIVPLEKKYSKGTIPGLKLERWEGRRIVHYDGKDPSNQLCRYYRLDNRSDCIVRSIKENFYIVRIQGLRTHINLPMNLGQHLIRGYKEVIKDTVGWKEKRISIISHGGLNFNSEGEKLFQSTDNLSQPQFFQANQSQFGNIKKCGKVANDLSERLNTFESIQEHISRYRDFSMGTALRPVNEIFASGDYPEILIYDNFNSTPGRVAWEEINHPILNGDAEINCIETEPNDTGHGIFALGLLIGKNSSVGKIGLLSDLPRNKIRVVQENGSIDFDSIIDAAIEAEESGRTVIVNLSITQSVQEGSSERVSMLKTIQATPDVLYVVSAGQPKRSADGYSLKKNCNIIPACFGNEPNVITVAALDEIMEGEHPTLWKRSNNGGEIVSIAAPGVKIISADLDSNNKPVISIRDGTSEAAIFITALAARIIALDPYLKPEDVKKRLMASAKMIKEHTYSQPEYILHLFGGSEKRVTAGAIDGGLAEKVTISENIVKLKNLSVEINGKIYPRPGFNNILFFQREKNNRGKIFQTCRALKIYRIFNSQPGFYSVLCEDTSGKLIFINEFNLEVQKIPPTSCLNDKNDGCFVLNKSNSGERQYIKFQEIEDAVFSQR